MEKIEIKYIEMLENYDDVLTVKELQKALKISRNTTYKLLRDNTISSIKIGSSFRIPKINVIKYLQNQ